MKKRTIFLSALLIAGASMSFAQKSNVKAADRFIDEDPPKFKEAREAIAPAFIDESTKDDPKTYYIAGMIGYKENEELLKLMYLQKEVDQIRKGKAIMESYNYFLKAYELDMTPNDKGKVKPKYDDKIKDRLKTYYTDQLNLISYGAKLFDTKDYEGAYKVFSVFLDIPKHPVMENEIPTNDSTYNMIKYFAALSATNAKDNTNAIRLYEDLTDDNYETKNVYQLLSEAYRTEKDTVKYLATLEKGFEIFNDEPFFLQNIINYYIVTNQIEKSTSYLDAAIAQNPNIPEYYYVKGTVEEQLGHIDVSRKAFEKAIELKPDYADGYAGIGRLIFNQAVEVLKAADKITDNKAYNAEVEKANEIFKQALPFMEKAFELNPDDNTHRQSLKTLYYRLGENEKYDAL